MGSGRRARSAASTAVFFDNICERADQTAVVDDARQAFANPGTGLRPRHVLPQPADGVRLDDPGVLLYENLPNRASDFLRPLAIDLAAAVDRKSTRLNSS